MFSQPLSIAPAILMTVASSGPEADGARLVDDAVGPGEVDGLSGPHSLSSRLNRLHGTSTPSKDSICRAPIPGELLSRTVYQLGQLNSRKYLWG